MMSLISLCGGGILMWGIETFGCAVNRWFEQRHNGEAVKDSDVLVIFKGKGDNSLAAQVPHPWRTWELHRQNKIKVIYKEILTVKEGNDFLEKIKSQNNRIIGLWIRAHGSPYTFQLSNKKEDGENSIIRNCDITSRSSESLFAQNSDDLAPLLSKTENNATILLESCQVAKSNNDKIPCIARTIASLAIGRTVIACTEKLPADLLSFKWGENGEINCRFFSIMESNQKGIIGKIINIFYFIISLITVCHYAIEDRHTTAIFRHAEYKENELYQLRN